MGHWLFKSEPDAFSIDDLKLKQKSQWDGVRNYQARNFMRDQMKLGDLIFFYHSSCEVPAIVGLCRVSRESHPDPTQFQTNGTYFDPLASLEKPRWFLVEVEFVEKFKRPLPLSLMREMPELQKLPLLQKGSRLSINPIEENEFQFILNYVRG